MFYLKGLMFVHEIVVVIVIIFILIWLCLLFYCDLMLKLVFDLFMLYPIMNDIKKISLPYLLPKLRSVINAWAKQACLSVEGPPPVCRLKETTYPLTLKWLTLFMTLTLLIAWTGKTKLEWCSSCKISIF